MPLADHSFAFVDLETTGSRGHADAITEVAVIGVEQGTVVEHWTQLLNPDCAIPAPIQLLTGIKPGMLSEQPRFKDIAPVLHAQLEGRILVAHNVRFDYAFLKNAFKRCGIDYRPRMLCTVKLSRLLNPERERHGLDVLIDAYGLRCDQRHRALDDALVMWDLMKAWIDEHGLERVRVAIDELVRRAAWPSQLDAATLDHLPNAPGVYLLYGERDALLYVGKSTRLRQRVLSHFASDHASGKSFKLAQQVRRVEHIRTGGDLGAQLLEARLIKQRQPIYNRQLRRTRQLVYFDLETDAAGYTRLKLMQSPAPPLDRLGEMVGLFRSRRAAQIRLRDWADRHGLCLRLLGLEATGTGACFAYQLQKCRGACCGAEDPASYNARLQRVIAGWRVKVWPYVGPKIIKESAAGITEYHLIDQWCHLASAPHPADLNNLRASPHGFDYDTYRILVKAVGRA